MVKKVPKLRFPEFSGDWEQRRCEDFACFSKGNGYSKSDLLESGTPIILYGRLYTKYEFFISNVDTFAKEKVGAIYSEGNEVIIPASGETSDEIARASAVIKPHILLGSDLNIIRPNKSVAPEFLALSLSNGKPQKELAKRAQGKTVVHLYNSDLREIKIAHPNIDEQNKIVSLLKTINSTIKLHQRKLESLKKVKKSLLQKMFV